MARRLRHATRRRLGVNGHGDAWAEAELRARIQRQEREEIERALREGALAADDHDRSHTSGEIDDERASLPTERGPGSASVAPSPSWTARDPGAPGLLVLWRRKWTVVLITLLCACSFGGVYLLLPDRYDSTVRLEARSSGQQSSFEFLQASQILARTYSEVARSGVIAELVARRLPFERSRASVLGDVSVVTINDTPLIKITATDDKRSRARTLANTYANTLLRYVDRQKAQEGSLSLVHPAEAPTRAGPGMALMVGLGALIGLLLGIAIAFLKERLEPYASRRL
jgi:capsular polysaccharide biosynthesis protein